jgi:F-type H+-transporting ATPase subunit epsilon
VAERLRLSVVTPERALLEEEAEEVQVPGLNGYLGILPGHAPLFSELAIGRLSYRQASGTGSLMIAGGFVEVLDDDVRVLASVAEPATEIDVTRAREALRRARARLGTGGGDVDYDRALAAAHRASARIEVTGEKPDR